MHTIHTHDVFTDKTTNLVEVIGVPYFADWSRGPSWKRLLNNNPGIIYLLQCWERHY